MTTANCTLLQLWGTSWGIGWGGGPSYTSGGSLPPYGEYDIFCLCGEAVADLADFAGVTVTPGDPAHGYANPSGGYTVASEDSVESEVYLPAAMPRGFTLDAVVRVESLPPDFDTSTQRLFIGSYDDTFFCAGLFLSSMGLAFGGAADDTPLILPASGPLITNNETYLLRLVMNGETETVYVYWSTLAEAEVLGSPVLRYQLPALGSAEVPVHVEGVYVSALNAQLTLLSVCTSSAALIPNLPPVAEPGPDQLVNGCSAVKLDGSRSQDPERFPLLYSWRLIDGPTESSYVEEGQDGGTLNDVSGYTNKFYSMHTPEGSDPFPYVEGDVLLLGGVPYAITGYDTDGDGAYFEVEAGTLPAGLSSQGWKLVHQAGMRDADKQTAVLLPDVGGSYRVELVVSDGILSSAGSTTLVQVLSQAPVRGVLPNASLLWGYMSDVTRLLEDGDRLEVVWGGLMQVLGSLLLHAWEVDEGKSLGRIPRTLARRWLNYDLLLREPFPYLTKHRSVWRGVLSADLEPSGLSLGGQVLVLSLPYRESLVSVTLPSNAVSPVVLARSLRGLLRAIDARFDCSVCVLESGEQGVRVYAPFPFTVVAGTTAPFTIGGTNEPLAGADSDKLGTNTLRLDTSLTGVPVETNDVLVLKTADGHALVRVAGVQDVATDDYRMQRILTQEPLPVGLTGEWAFALQLKSPQLDFWKGLVCVGDPVAVEISDSQEDVSYLQLPCLGVVEQLPGVLLVYPDETLVPALVDPQRFEVRLWGAYRRGALPVDPLVRSVPFLQRLIRESPEGEILRENLDFQIKEFRGVSAIVFRTGEPALWVGDLVPRLWAEYTYLDNSPTIESNFGAAVGLRAEDVAGLNNVDYLSAVRGLWYAYVRGSRVSNLRVGAQILLGLPFAESAGEIVELDPQASATQGRIVVKDTDSSLLRIYSYPRTLSLETSPTTQLPYTVGDKVSQFAPLVRGVEVVDYVSDPAWILPYLSQGILRETDRFHRFLVRVDLDAFALPSLLFIQSFLKRIKPSRTKPLFLVRKQQAPEEIDVSDAVLYRATLHLFCSPHMLRPPPVDATLPYQGLREGWALMFDQAEYTAAGAYVGSFDIDGFPDTSGDLPNAPIGGGFDSGNLLPETGLTGTVTLDYDGVAAMSVFEELAEADQPVFNRTPLIFARHWLRSLGEAGQMLALPVTCPQNITVNYAQVRLEGEPPAAGFSYTFEVYLDGVFKAEIVAEHNAYSNRYEFGPSPATDPFPVTPFAVTAGQDLRVLVRPADGELALEYVARGVVLVLGQGVSWSSGGPSLAAGDYTTVRML